MKNIAAALLLILLQNCPLMATTYMDWCAPSINEQLPIDIYPGQVVSLTYMFYSRNDPIGSGGTPRVIAQSTACQMCFDIGIPNTLDVADNKLHIRDGSADGDDNTNDRQGFGRKSFILIADPDLNQEGSCFVHFSFENQMWLYKVRYHSKRKPFCSNQANPVSSYYGNKEINETDISNQGIIFSRRYTKPFADSMATFGGYYWRSPFTGGGWTHGLNYHLCRTHIANTDTMVAINGNGDWNIYSKINDSLYKTETGYSDILKHKGNAWHLYKNSGQRLRFNDYGGIDSLINPDGSYFKFYVKNDSTYLDSVADKMGRKLFLRYEGLPNNANRKVLARAFCDSAQIFYEYRYDSTVTFNLTRIVAHVGSDTLIDNRYYYGSNGINKNNTANITYIQNNITDKDTGYWYNRNRGDRLCCWYDSTGRLYYQEMIKGDDDTLYSDDAVVYRAYLKYHFNALSDTSNRDTTEIYYWEDTTFVGAHDPADSSFHPQNNLTTWLSNGKYFKKFLIFYKTGPTYKEITWALNSDSSVVTNINLNADFNVQTKVGANSDTTKFTYPTYKLPGDATTRYWPSPSMIVYPNNDTTRTFFSAKGDSNRRLADSSWDELGNRTWYCYDASKNYLDTAVVYKSRQLADGDANYHDITTHYYYYGSSGNLKETVDPLGHKTRMYYTPDSAGLYMSQQRIIMSSDTGSSDIVTKYGYNTSTWNMDTMTFYRDYPSNPSITRYYYDQFNRVTRATYPDTSWDSTVYDLRGNVLKRYTIKTDTLSKTVYEYNPHDLLTMIKAYRAPKDTPAVFDTTFYYYNMHDRLIKLVNPLGKATNYTYVMDRLREIEYPDTTQESFGYYADGSLKYTIDRKGQVTEYVYDGTSGGCGCPSSSRYRLVLKKQYVSWAQYTDGYGYAHPAVRDSFVYDKVGNRTKLIDTLGVTQYAYDGLYRLKTDSCGYLNTKVTYQYDQAGNRTRMKVCNGNESTVYLDQQYKGYDHANRCDSVTVSGNDYVFDYWDTGTPKSIKYYDDGGARITEYYYLTNRGFIDSIRTAYWTDAPSTAYWFKNKYTYNGLGDRTSQNVYLTRPGTSVLTGTINYAYDGLRRLKMVKNPSGFNNGDTLTYTYDAAGNRTYKDSRKTNDFEYAINVASNQIDKYTVNKDDYRYDYDANGNMLEYILPNDDKDSYSYDFENRLTFAEFVGSPHDSTRLHYNGDGVRLKKTSTSDTSTQYIPDGMNTVVERTTTGRARYKYVYANGMLLARIDSAGTTYYYSHDALGSVVGASNINGVFKSFLYDEFGDSLGAWGATKINNYRFTGQEYDITPLNAYNLRAREYYPKLGRFMQNDPIGDKGGSLNWYLYVANNPVNYFDLLGLVKTNCTDAEMRSEASYITNTASSYYKYFKGSNLSCADMVSIMERKFMTPQASTALSNKCCNMINYGLIIQKQNWNVYIPLHNFIFVECGDKCSNTIEFSIDPWMANLIGKNSPIFNFKMFGATTTPTGYTPGVTP